MYIIINCYRQQENQSLFHPILLAIVTEVYRQLKCLLVSTFYLLLEGRQLNVGVLSLL